MLGFLERVEERGKAKNARRLRKAKDGKGRPVRGLWLNDTGYFFQLGPRGNSVRRKMRATNMVDAMVELEEIQEERRKSGNVGVGDQRTIAELAEVYFEDVQTQKKPRTIEIEKHTVRLASEWFKRIDVRRMRTIDITRWRQDLLKSVGPRTAALHCSILKTILKWAVRNDLIRENPCDRIAPIKFQPAQRPLLTEEQIGRLYDAAEDLGYTSLMNYMEFLRLTGARKNEALLVKWEDVAPDFSSVKIGVITSKSGRSRVVHSSAALKEHLKAMRAEQLKATWVFENEDGSRIESLVFQFAQAHKKSGLGIKSGLFGFHLFRHYFASRSLAAGVDVATVAQWLGHSDGGKLLLKTYNHLTSTHSAEMASKLNLQLQPGQSPTVNSTCDPRNGTPPPKHQSPAGLLSHSNTTTNER